MSFHNKINRNYGFSSEKINPQENLFHAIYFLDYETGALLVSNRFSNNLSFLKDDLICSFLNAINLFINELKEGGNEEQKEIVEQQIEIKTDAKNIVEKFETEVKKLKKDDEEN